MAGLHSAATTFPGEIMGQAKPLAGLVRAFRFYPDGSSEELNADQPIAEREGWLWLHFNLADRRACEFLNSTSCLPPPARRLLVSTDEHQQLHRHDACIYGVLANLVCGLSGVTEEIGFFHFAMTETHFVSGRRHNLLAVEATSQALRRGLKITRPAALFEVITEQTIEVVDRYAEDLASHLDRAEERILADDITADRQSIGRVRRMTVRLHRQLVTLRSLMHRFEHDIEPHSNRALELATGKLSQRLDWLDTEIVALRDRSHLLQEEITLKTAEQTNRNLHVLATVTTVFLPASLVAGIFGMNVELPLDPKTGFLSAMAIIIGAAAIVYWFLKRSGILGR
jgi:zinc transporter